MRNLHHQLFEGTYNKCLEYAGVLPSSFHAVVGLYNDHPDSFYPAVMLSFQDAGYGEKYFFTPENEDDSDDQVTIEDEVMPSLLLPLFSNRVFVFSYAFRNCRAPFMYVGRMRKKLTS